MSSGSAYARRATFALFVGGAVAVVTAFLFVIAYAVVNLYLSGHSIKPAWFDTAADALLLIVVAAGALGGGTLAWRSGRPRGTIADSEGE